MKNSLLLLLSCFPPSDITSEQDDAPVKSITSALSTGGTAEFWKVVSLNAARAEACW